MEQVSDERRLEILKEEFLNLSSEKRMEFIEYTQDYLFTNIKNSAYSKIENLKKDVTSGIEELRKNFQEKDKQSDPEKGKTEKSFWKDLGNIWKK